MVMASPKDETEFLPLVSIVLGIVEEHLDRNGGACLLRVKTVATTIKKRLGIEGSKTLTTEIDTILEPLYRFWGYTSSRTCTYKDGERNKIPGKGSRLYELRRVS